jgi:hypothetical protein
MSSATVSTVLSKALNAFSRELLENTITAIAQKHNLDVAETLREFMPDNFTLETKRETKCESKTVKEKKANHVPTKTEKHPVPVKTEQPKFVLPWCNKINEDWCSALRANYGLYTQCTMPPKPGENFCKTCTKHVQQAPDGIPPCGTVQSRMSVSCLEYRDPKGKKASLYSAYMKKNNLTPEMVRDEAIKFGFTVPDEQLNTVSSGRGRPKKSTVVDDSASDNSCESNTKKKPGRPKKGTNVEPQAEDLIAAAMNNSSHISSTQSSPQSPPPNLASTRTNLTIDLNADSGTLFQINDSDSPRAANFQKISLTPDSDDDSDPEH